MTHWVRFEHRGETKFGTLQNDAVTIHLGDMFTTSEPTSETVALDEVKILTPTAASKMVALWNNFHAMATKFNLTMPEEPLYFIKSTGSFLASGETIRCPASYDGRVVFEGELGVVIGTVCKAVAEADADRFIFGYTCVNDVTAFELINKDASFAQWTRAKSFDTFGPFGPIIATGLDPAELSIKTILNGAERQNYPVSDMIFSPAKLVSLISKDMTLFPGDVITCGTSVGAGSMKPGSTIEVVIDGIGCLRNSFE
ncbi:MAG: fumarylacetoacetate hydrolase family protein [Gammaproteobacteria bacterium]|jgi:2-keto-4-pentenoate hydratase/2-oxohepta-3-ene-1,7-dioic acid hydratase in catechol pathway|nr:fumarylacetoacetate hydrolase family protein [Gammaproteobacteria bacterium]